MSVSMPENSLGCIKTFFVPSFNSSIKPVKSQDETKLFSDLSALIALEKNDPLIFHLAYIKVRKAHKQTVEDFKKTFALYKTQRLAVIASLGKKEEAV